MKSKKIIILASIIVAGLGVSFTTFAVSSANNDGKNAVTCGANKVSMMTNLEEVQAEGERMFGNYTRKIAELNGEISIDSPRLTLDKLNQIMTDYADYSEIETKLNELYPYPDYVGGSGVSITEYWLDESGSNKIRLIAEEESITHIIDYADDEGDVYDVLIEGGRK